MNINDNCKKFCKLLHPLFGKISKKLQEQKKILLSELNPLTSKLKQYNDKLMFKSFCSFTLDSSSITTKVINSNPKDKIHLFPGQKGNKGYNLFILMIMPQTVIIMFFSI